MAIETADEAPAADRGEDAGRWRALAVVAIGELLAMAPWFSASAVAPVLATEWHLDRFDLPLLTIAVQLGFAAGALALAATAAVDVLPAPKLFAVSALLAAGSNLGFAVLSTSTASAVPFRVLTGVALAGVYPVGLKLLVGWFRRERGLAIGVLVGALTIGSALPYLIRALGIGAGLDWRATVIAASVIGGIGGLIVLAGASAGPWDTPAPRFSIDVARRAFAQPSVRLASLGYLGHMWELYAMWTWAPLFLAASFAAAGSPDQALASSAAFVVVASGGLGCVVAGLIADRFGRTATTIAAMAVSGSSAVAVALLFGAPPAVTLLIAVIWGVSIVADSAQFSTAVSELAPSGTAGSALAVQMAAGFLLTGITILTVGLIGPDQRIGWSVAFLLLALGPLAGIVAMWRLRQRPEAVAMAGGRR